MTILIHTARFWHMINNQYGPLSPSMQSMPSSYELQRVFFLDLSEVVFLLNEQM